MDTTIGDLDFGSATSGDLTIAGHRDGTTIDADDMDRHFHVFGVQATFKRLELRDGSVDWFGGSVWVYENARATFERVKILENQGATGGGLSLYQGASATLIDTTIARNISSINAGGIDSGSAATLTLRRSSVLDNDSVGRGAGIAGAGGAAIKLVRSAINGNDTSGDGGGISLAFGEFEMSKSSIIGNSAEGIGGGIQAFNAPVKIEDSTIANNDANEGGGGFVRDGVAGSPRFELTNSTISGNDANADGVGPEGQGGGLAIALPGEKVITSSTITGNSGTEGGGVFGPVFAGIEAPVLKGTILQGNTTTAGSGPDCRSASTVTTLGHNLFGNLGGCSITPAGSDLVGDDPLLGPLRDNGGPTRTHALGAGSPAIGEGPPDAPPRDQRGVKRDNRPDIGAYER